MSLPNNIKQTEQEEKDVLLSLKITLKKAKQPDYEGLVFEELVKNFYDHIEVKSLAARKIWESGRDTS